MQGPVPAVLLSALLLAACGQKPEPMSQAADARMPATSPPTTDHA